MPDSLDRLVQGLDTVVEQMWDIKIYQIGIFWYTSVSYGARGGIVSPFGSEKEAQDGVNAMMEKVMAMMVQFNA